MAVSLLSTTSRVETPFIIVTIEGYTFGSYSKTTANVIDSQGFTRQVKETFPNIVNSVDIVKVNGTVNTYTIGLVYAIRAGDDPNKIDKILSTASKSRKLIISYGDYSSPHFIYKEEEALITRVTSSVNIASSSISYTITAVSSASTLTGGSYNFPKRNARPSDVVKEMLYNEKYGLLDVFYGMRDKELVAQKGIINVDDKKVIIEARNNVSIFDYLDYLVSCMTSAGDNTNSITDQTKYIFSVFDDFSGEFGGPYFKIAKVAKNIQSDNNLNMYEIDIGYPTANIVTSFTVNTNDAYTILYEYSKKIKQDEYSYRINDDGEYEYIYNPTLSNSVDLYRTTQADKNWWSQVTSYPISATVTLKGLLRPAILMTYIKLNVYFYGRKHNTSGVYIITKQEDSISSAGFKTTLSLTRIQGDDSL